MKRLGVEMPEYSEESDPTKRTTCDMEWTIPLKWVKDIDEQHKQMLKDVKKRKSEESSNEPKIKKTIDHLPKIEPKEETE